MTENEDNKGFDPRDMVDEIVEELGFANENPERLNKFKTDLLDEISYIIFDTASMHINPTAVERVMNRYKDVEDPAFLMSHIIKASPEAQVAIFEELEIFRAELVGGCKNFEKRNKKRHDK